MPPYFDTGGIFGVTGVQIEHGVLIDVDPLIQDDSVGMEDIGFERNVAIVLETKPHLPKNRSRLLARQRIRHLMANSATHHRKAVSLFTPSFHTRPAML